MVNYNNNQNVKKPNSKSNAEQRNQRKELHTHVRRTKMCGKTRQYNLQNLMTFSFNGVYV